jgi:colanic acid/amylovoran biosynthesis protein WcaK/AmsJ
MLPKSVKIAGRAIRDSNLSLSCAGGFLHDSNLTTLTMLAQLWVAVAFKRRVVITPQSIGPYRRPLVRKAAAYVLNRCTLIFVRESVSHDCVAGLLGNAGHYATPADLDAAAPRATNDTAVVVRTTDLAFFFDKSDRATAEAVLRERFGLGDDSRFLAASDIEWPFSDQSEPAAARQRYIEALGGTLRRAAEHYGMPILLVNQVSADLTAARSLQEIVGDQLLVDTEDRPPAVLRAMLSKAQAFIGSRFHSCIFAMLEGVPTIAISYLHKTDGIMADLGYADRVHSINALDSDRLVSQLQSLMSDRDAVSRQILADIDSLRHRFPLFTDIMRRYGI